MITKRDWEFAPSPTLERKSRIRLLINISLFITVCIILVFFGAPAVRMYLGVEPMLAFRPFFYAVQLGVIMAGAGLLLSIIAAIKGPPTTWKTGLVVVLLGLIPAGIIIGVLGPNALDKPMIHDISTDTTSPPEFSSVVSLRGAGDNSLEYADDKASRQHAAYPDIRPLTLRLAYQQAMDRALDTATHLGWNIVNVDFDKGIIEAYDTSRIFGFVDDVVIRVQKEGNATVLDIRSVSRKGMGDLGKNAERIRQFISVFEQ